MVQSDAASEALGYWVVFVPYAAPIAAIFLWRWLMPRRGRAVFRTLLVVGGAFFVIYLLLWSIGTRTTNIRANVMFVLAAYTSYAVLAAACWWTKLGRHGRILGIVAYLPFMPLLIPVTPFVIEFALYDALRFPSYEAIAPNIICESSLWGLIGSSGQTFELFRRYPYLPFLWRRIAVLSIADDDPPTTDLDVSCDGLARSAGLKKLTPIATSSKRKISKASFCRHHSGTATLLA